MKTIDQIMRQINEAKLRRDRGAIARLTDEYFAALAKKDRVRADSYYLDLAPCPKNDESEMSPALQTEKDLDEMRRQEAFTVLSEDIQRLVREGARCGEEGLVALRRIAKQIAGRDNQQAILMRGFLISLFNGQTVALNEICCFDFDLRKDLCAVVLGLNHSPFSDYKIRDIFIEEGDRDAHWFLAGIIKEATENDARLTE